MKRADRHSRTVAWLKVALPIVALALLSTLFLLSRAIDPNTTIPFADKEIQARLRDQQVTGPFFSGTTTDGDQLSFRAEKLTTPNGQTGANQAEDVLAELKLNDGAEITVHAKLASFDIARDIASLSGDVEFLTSTGYRLKTEALVSEMSTLHLQSPGKISGTGPPGVLEAGAMLLTLPKGARSAQLLFTNGVKLIYTPKEEQK